MPKTVNEERPADGEVLYNTDEKLFEDIKANPGEKAFVFIHTVPYEGSVALVNLLTSTRLVRKGFDVSIVLYGPGVLLASGTRGFPAVGPAGAKGVAWTPSRTWAGSRAWATWSWTRPTTRRSTRNGSAERSPWRCSRCGSRAPTSTPSATP